MWYQDPEWVALVRAYHLNHKSALHKGVLMDWLEERSIDVRTLPYYEEITMQSVYNHNVFRIGMFHNEFIKPSGFYTISELLSWYPVDRINLLGVTINNINSFYLFSLDSCKCALDRYGLYVRGVLGRFEHVNTEYRKLIIQRYLGV